MRENSRKSRLTERNSAAGSRREGRRRGRRPAEREQVWGESRRGPRIGSPSAWAADGNQGLGVGQRGNKVGLEKQKLQQRAAAGTRRGLAGRHMGAGWVSPETTLGSTKGWAPPPALGACKRGCTPPGGSARFHPGPHRRHWGRAWWISLRSQAGGSGGCGGAGRDTLSPKPRRYL